MKEYQDNEITAKASKHAEYIAREFALNMKDAAADEIISNSFYIEEVGRILTELDVRHDAHEILTITYSDYVGFIIVKD